MRLVRRGLAAACLILGLSFWLISDVPLFNRAAHAQGEVWSTPVNLTADRPIASWLPAIAADRAGNLHLVWTEQWETGWFWGRIFYTMYDGSSWTPPLRISTDDTEIAILPSVAVDSHGTIHVVFAAKGYLQYTRSQAWNRPWLAESWSHPRPVGGFQGPYWSDIAIDDEDNIHVVSRGTLSAESVNDMMYIRSTDGGQTWTNAVVLWSSPLVSMQPRIAVRGRDVYVTWMDADFTVSEDVGIQGYFVHSQDGGDSWLPPVLFWDGMIATIDVAFDGSGNVHLTFWDEQGRVRLHQWSADGGETWSDPIPVLRYPDGSTGGWGHGWADMAVDSAGTVHVVEVDESSYPGNAVVHTWWDGESWATPTIIFDVFRSSRARMVISEGNRIHAVWAWAERTAYPVVYDVFYSTTQWSSAPHIPPTPFRPYGVYLPLVVKAVALSR